jgi:hypothetical protein
VHTFTLAARGPFSPKASTRFLEGLRSGRVRRVRGPAAGSGGRGGGNLGKVSPRLEAEYLGGTNLTGPLTVLAVYAATGALLTLAAAAWRQHHPASPATQPQPA